MDAEQIARHIDDHAQRKSSGWRCRCPAHGGEDFNLSVRDGDDGVGVKCFSHDCSFESIVEGSGLKASNFFYDDGDSVQPVRRPPQGPKPTAEQLKSLKFGDVVAEYVYNTIDGDPLYRQVRYDPKDFRIHRWNGSRWVSGMGATERTLYHADEVWRCNGKPVFFVEGEKDVDNLRKGGLVATTLAGGSSGPWSENMTRILINKNVFIIPDNDKPGRELAERVRTHVPHAKVLTLDVPEKGDVTDWLDNGGSIDRLLEMTEPPTIDDEPEWANEYVLPPERPGMWSQPMGWDEIANYPPVKWEVDQVFAVGDNVGMIFGPSGEGKTFVAIDLIISLMKGKGKWAGKFEIRRPMTVCYATGEGFNGIPARLEACADHHNLVKSNQLQVYRDIPILTGKPEDEAHIDNFILQQVKMQAAGSPILDVVVLDTLHNAAPGAQENDNTEMGLVIRLAKKASKELGCLVLLIHHAGKNGDYRGASALRGDMNFMLKITGEKKRKMEWFKTKEGENWGQVLFDLEPHMGTVIIKWEGDNPVLSAIIEAFEFTTDEHLNTGNLVACLIENVGMGKTASENAVKQMVSDGWIKQVKSKGSGKNYVLTHKAESLP